jgi:hypothetical protein
MCIGGGLLTLVPMPKRRRITSTSTVKRRNRGLTGRWGGEEQKPGPAAPPDRDRSGRRDGPPKLTAHDNSQQAGVMQ